MLFNSVLFLCYFLPAVLLVYFVLPKAAKPYWLLCVSLVFYFSGGGIHILLLLAVATLDYVFGMLLYLLRDRNALKKTILVLSVAANLSVLGYKKYIVFIQENLLKYLHIKMDIGHPELPIGISFFVFQGLSYVIDVYRGLDTDRDPKSSLPGCEVQRNYFKLVLYIALFPQLIAGPIVRYNNIKDRIDSPSVSAENIACGFERFAIGLAKKVILADTLASVCDPIFDLPADRLASHIALIGAVFYAFQICLDFSGYSDMAIGMGKMMGFEFPENFDMPYRSHSITEFWRRWHISLSSWFRDYVYIPLGGNRKGNVYINLMIVFALTGLWHGASWNFVAWGLSYGIIIVIEKALKKHLGGRIQISGFMKKLLSVFGWIYAMSVVGIEWVMFRCDSLSDALRFYRTMLGDSICEFSPFRAGWYLTKYNLFILAVAVFVTIFPHKEVMRCLEGSAALHRALPVIKRVLSVALLVLSLIYVMNGTYSPFIYFRF